MQYITACGGVSVNERMAKYLIDGEDVGATYCEKPVRDMHSYATPASSFGVLGGLVSSDKGQVIAAKQHFHNADATVVEICTKSVSSFPSIPYYTAPRLQSSLSGSRARMAKPVCRPTTKRSMVRRLGLHAHIGRMHVQTCALVESSKEHSLLCGVHGPRPGCVSV